eukprot:14789562-Alexandrium_andersonii.AAC.1
MLISTSGPTDISILPYGPLFLPYGAVREEEGPPRGPTSCLRGPAREEEGPVGQNGRARRARCWHPNGAAVTGAAVSGAV